MNIEDIFIKYYKVFKTTESIQVDLKLIKKINNLISKWLKTDKEMYKDEIMNIFKINENIFNVNNSFIELIKENFIEKQHIKTFDRLYSEFHENL